MNTALGACLIALLASSLPVLADDPAIAPHRVPGTPFEQRAVTDGTGRAITYYVSHPKKPKAPILLMIQGSGCVPIMHVQPGGTFTTLFDLGPFAQDGDFTVMAVEKPFADGKQEHSGMATSCGREFNEDFTAESWLLALRTALKDARTLAWVDTSRTLLFGFSEGANMADMLAGHDDTITDVIAMGGSGTTQLFDFVAKCYRSFEPQACLSETERNVAAINANPSSATEFAWGHPYKRWSSFFRLDTGDELLKSKARIYIAFGTGDTATPALSEEVAIAKLRAAGRDLTVRRVPDAGHTLSSTSNPSWSDLDREYRDALKWFWSRQ